MRSEMGGLERREGLEFVVCSLLGEGAKFEARVLVRDGACANELHLMVAECAVLGACLGCVGGS